MEKFEQVLKIISEKLKGINYALIGSLNLQIQGIDIKPNDIDILTTPEDIKKIEQILKGYQTKEVYFDESGGVNSFKTFFEIEGIEVEVLGNVDNTCRPKDSLIKKIIIDFNGIKLPCIPLEEELFAYQKMGREDKVNLINNYLKNYEVKRY